ncbi:MAG: hypothetical protein HRU20_27720 [Pseudomonadales bacterium]|nr:hypothetical protein [Pseudomonadales bacterium]
MKACIRLFLFIVISCAVEAQDINLQFAGTDWCPYSCVDDNKPGIMTEYGQYIFSEIGGSLSVTLMPWNRAMVRALNNEVDGLITASALEAKGLKRTAIATIYYQMCFYVLPESDWEYTGLASIDKIILGGIQGYSYGEPVDAYISVQRNNVRLIAGNIEMHSRLKTMLELNRIGALIADKQVLQHKIGNSLKQVGCLDSTALYFAFSQDINQSLIDKIDIELIKDENIRQLQKIIDQYTYKE